MATYPIYCIKYHTADDNRGRLGRKSFCDRMPGDVANTTMTGEKIGLAVCYDSVAKIGHVVVPDGLEHTINYDNDCIEITKRSAIDGTPTTWRYGLDELVREGVARENRNTTGGPLEIIIKG